MNIFISEDDMCTTQKLNLARVHKWFETIIVKLLMMQIKLTKF